MQAGKEKLIYFLENEKFVSEYQGRIYINEPLQAFDMDGNFRYNRMLEFISEPFRLYMEDKESLKTICPEAYKLIKEVVE